MLGSRGCDTKMRGFGAFTVWNQESTGASGLGRPSATTCSAASQTSKNGLKKMSVKVAGFSLRAAGSLILAEKKARP